MKVISLQEPYGTLILKGHKKIETRSWKTSYRGELYIHTSKSLFRDCIVEKAYKYISKDELTYGYIISFHSISSKQPFRYVQLLQY